MENNMKDLAELLDTVTEKVPKLLNGVISTIYSAESGEQLGKAVGAFYKSLVDSGIPATDALEMAKDYMTQIKGVVSDATKS